MELRPSSFRTIYTASPVPGWLDVWALCGSSSAHAIRFGSSNPNLRSHQTRLACIGRTATVGLSLSLVQPMQIWDIDRSKLEHLVSA